MSPKFRVTQPVYMVASNRMVQLVTVKQIDYDKKLYLVGFESAGGIWVNENRLFAEEAEAVKYLKQFKKDRENVRKYRDKLH